MMTAYSQHPNQLQQHPGVPQGPQQHLQGHPGHPGHAAMQHLHPQQQAQVQQAQAQAHAQAQAQAQAAYQQQQQQLALAAGMNPQLAQMQLARRQQQQQQAHMMGGMGGPGMVFQNPNGGAPQIRAGIPNGLYASAGPGGIPSANMGGYGAGNPHMRGSVNLPPHVQQQLQHHQQQQHQQHQQQMVAQQMMANQANAAANAQAPMNMPQQPQMPMQAVHAQQAAMVAAQARGGVPKSMIGQSVLALYRFSSNLGTFVTSERQNDINYWRRFVAESYSPSGVMRQALWNNTTRETKQFEITTQVLARYYFTLFESGVQNIQIILENIREKELPNSCHIVDCGKTSFIYWFENGCHLVARGALRATFNASSQMEALDFRVDEHSEYVPRNFMRDSPDVMKSSPGSKALGKRPSQQGSQAPDSLVNHFGVTDSVFRCLEIAETMSQMRDLFNFSQLNPSLAPRQALQTIVTQQHQQQQHLAHQHAQHQQQVHAAAAAAAAQGLQGPQGPSVPIVGPGMPQHPGQHPGMPTNGSVGMNSPSANEMRLGIPPSPHMGGGGPGTTPSPAPNHIQAPGLVQQHSQQTHPTNPGSQTGPAAASANTSPNQPQKRRRPSTTGGVKNEDDDSGGVNGTQTAKVKQSPRPGGKRVKANNA